MKSMTNLKKLRNGMCIMHKKLEIIIDARIVNKNLNGIARYTYEIVKYIANKNDIHIRLLVNDLKMADDIFGRFNNVDFIKMKSKFLSPFEQIELPLVVNRYKDVDIFHSPSFVASPFIKCKMIMTIHDLIHINFKEYSTMLRKIYYKFIVKRSALKCSKILTVSQFSKQEIIRWLKCDESKVEVTYCGVDESFKIIDDKDSLLRVKREYKLPDEFILYIGNQKPHKNVKTLIEAIKLIKTNITLVINGKPNEELINMISQYNLDDKVKFIGYVKDKDLPILYNIAKVFVFPSLYEGFGLPPLEAISCGCPVVTSNVTSIPEIIGDIADMINPNSALELSKAIDKNIKIDRQKYYKLVKGYSNKFKWIYTAQNTYEVYKKENKNFSN